MEHTPQLHPRRRSIRRQLLLGGLSISLLLIAASTIIFLQVNRLSTAAADFQSANAQAKAALKAEQVSTKLIAIVSQLLPLKDADLFNASISEILDELLVSRTTLQQFTRLPMNSSEIELEDALATINNLMGIAETMLNQANNEQWPSAQLRMGILIRDQQKFSNQIAALVEQTQITEQKASDQLASARQAVVVYPTLALIISIMLTLFLALQTNRNIAQPIEKLTNAASNIAMGALDQRVEITREDEFGQLGNAFNVMAQQIQTSQAELEQRVAARTLDLELRARQLQAAAEVGQAATTIRDIDDLFSQATHLISERFDFYHAGIFLLDSTGEYAVLQAANSEGGQRMLARNHQLEVSETSIVGYATARRQPRIALDVGRDAVYFDNPDMPATRSEMALPLIVGDKLLGALDVQSKRSAAFSDEDIVVLQVLANQLAIAIENARLFTENQETLEATRRAYTALSQESWQEFLRTEPQLGFLATSQQSVNVSKKPWTSEMIEAARRGSNVRLDERTLAIPIVLRGHTLGVVRLKKDAAAPPWNTDEINLMDALIDQLEFALENARSHRDAQQRAARESLVTEITTKIRSTNHPQEMLEIAISELREALQAKRAQIMLQES